MFKNLSPSLIGVSGRQSELIELALTFGFHSLEVNIDDFVKKAQKQTVEHAARFLTSGQLKLGSFQLPIEWRGTEEAYRTELEQLEAIAQVAAAAGGTVCYTPIEPASDVYPYHDNFELHRKRLAEIAENLGKHELRLGIALQPLPAHRAGKEFQFIFEADALVTLMKSIPASNVGLYIDTWNWHFGGGTVGQLGALDGSQVVGLTVADAPTGIDTESASESQRLLPSDEGVIDIVGMISQLKDLGVRAPVSLAAAPESFSGLNRERIVQKCSQVLDDLWKVAGLVPDANPTPALSS